MLSNHLESRYIVKFSGNSPPLVLPPFPKFWLRPWLKRLLIVHAMTGCDTVNSIFGHGKQKLFNEQATSTIHYLDIADALNLLLSIRTNNKEIILNTILKPGVPPPPHTAHNYHTGSTPHTPHSSHNFNTGRTPTPSFFTQF